MSVDFIGLGAQKAGTSWVYACLYEHPEVCAPIKEIHFFSRDRFEKGRGWYESHFTRCKEGKKRGEFSTSYLYTPETAERISKMYPDAKLIAIVRNPINRAYSQYKNAVKAGEISKETKFSSYIKHVDSALAQGKYAEQLARYYKYYSAHQLLVLVYEDSKRDPLAFMKQVYTHLEIDPEFVPKMLRTYVNVERTPRFVFIERIMHRVAEFMRRVGLDKIVWFIKRSGATDAVRSINTTPTAPKESLDPALEVELKEYFKEDVRALSGMLNRNLSVEWGIEKP